jgi:hypothetical protein
MPATLPLELIRLIAENLDLDTTDTFALCNKTFHDVIKSVLTERYSTLTNRNGHIIIELLEKPAIFRYVKTLHIGDDLTSENCVDVVMEWYNKQASADPSFEECFFEILKWSSLPKFMWNSYFADCLHYGGPFVLYGDSETAEATEARHLEAPDRWHSRNQLAFFLIFMTPNLKHVFLDFTKDRSSPCSIFPRFTSNSSYLRICFESVIYHGIPRTIFPPYSWRDDGTRPTWSEMDDVLEGLGDDIASPAFVKLSKVKWNRRAGVPAQSDEQEP